MADNNTNQERPRGFEALKQHVIENKSDVVLWASRVLTIIFAIGYMLPIFGFVFLIFNLRFFNKKRRSFCFF